MDKETLRMQMLSGIITESEYKAKLEETGMFNDPIGYEKSEPNPKDKIFTKEYKGNGMYVIYKNGKEVKTIEGEGNANAWINDEMRKLKENKKSLNENFVGMGMVGNIFDREKTDYELAFEHFTKGTSLNEEVEEAMVNPNTSDRVSYLENVLDMVWKRGKGNNPIDFKDLSQSIVNDMFDDLKEGKDEMPEAPSHEETDAAQVYEDELSEDISKVSIYQEGKKWIVAHPVATRLETKEFDAIEDAYEYYAKVKSSSNK